MLAGEHRRQKVLFAIGDVTALMVAFTLALRLHDPSGAMETRLLETDPALLALATVTLAALWLVVFNACDLYGLRNGGIKESSAILKSCSIASLLSVLVGFFAHVEVSRLTFAIGYVLSICLVLITRTLVRVFIRRFYADPKIATPLAIVGFNPIAHYLHDQIKEQLSQYEIIGFVDEHAGGGQYDGLPVVCKIEQLGDLARTYPGLEAAIAIPDAPFERHEAIIRLCEEHHIRWWLVPRILRLPAAGMNVEVLGLVPLISPRGSNLGGLNFAIKRAFDLGFAIALLMISAPALAIAALAVWLFDGRPILFRQARVGIHGHVFEMLKFRTMRAESSDHSHRQYVRQWILGDGESRPADACDEPVFKLVADDRVTAIGRVLRRFSIDELPQLINVLRGEMSLVGPRPALPYEIELYQAWHKRRLDTVPGITGLWQVSGRNHLSFEQMVRLDVQYVESWSVGGDFKILARTLPVLLRGEGM